MGECKISLKELVSVRQKVDKGIDDYFNRFRTLKAGCFTQVAEYEFVELAVGGLDYSIRKKLDTQYLRDMTQLTYRFRQVELLKAEKARTCKFSKKKVTYVEVDNIGKSSDSLYACVEKNEVNVAELNLEPPYTCKLLKTSNGKNPVELKTKNIFLKHIPSTLLRVTKYFIYWLLMDKSLYLKGLKSIIRTNKEKTFL